MAFLEVENLHVEIDGKEILKGLDLTVNAGEVHAIMGPNGSGKSTLAYVLAGKADYETTAGEVRFNGKNIFDMQPDERAAAGLFLAFQYPMEIPGVATMTFLRTALNAQRKKRGEPEIRRRNSSSGCATPRRSSRSTRTCCAAPSMSAFPAARRSATKFCRWRCLSRGSPCSTKPIPASISTHSKSSPTASTGCAGRSGRSSSSPITSGCCPTSCPISCTCCRRPHRQDRRQGFGIGTRSARLCRVSGRGFGVNAGVTIIKTAAETALANTFSQARARLPGDGAIAAQRDAAFDVFAKEGLPHRRIEEWKYTDLRALMRDAKPLAPPPDAAAKTAAKTPGARPRYRGPAPGLRRRRLRC